MRFTDVIEAVTVEVADEVLVRRRALDGGMTVLDRLPRPARTTDPLDAVITSALDRSRWMPASPVLAFAGDDSSHVEVGVKVEVQARADGRAPEKAVLLTEHHRHALTDETVRYCEQINEPTGLGAYATVHNGSLLWDARLLPVRFTGHSDDRDDWIRAHTRTASGDWTPVAERPTVLWDCRLTARVMWQLICELSY